MDINCPIGQQIYKSIERGHMVPTPTGFCDKDSGWCYDLTDKDYFVRRKPQTCEIERIYVGASFTLPVDALEPDENLRVGSSTTYNELLWPPTLPPNVKANVRPHGRTGEQLLAYCRSKDWEVLEHDPAKWPYFDRPLPRGVGSSEILQPVAEIELHGWPVNLTRDLRTGKYYGNSDHASLRYPPPYAEAAPRRSLVRERVRIQQPLPAPPQSSDLDAARAERRARGQERRAASDAALAAARPADHSLSVIFSAGLLLCGLCFMGVAVGLAEQKNRRNTQR